MSPAKKMRDNNLYKMSFRNSPKVNIRNPLLHKVNTIFNEYLLLHRNLVKIKQPAQFDAVFHCSQNNSEPRSGLLF